MGRGPAPERQLVAQQAANGQSTESNPGGYIWPVDSPLYHLHRRRTGVPGGIGSTNHKGTDIGRVGYTSSVYASKAGTVIVSQYSSSYGNYVVISHGSGNTTLYAHMSSRKVSVGDYVNQGDVIGITGSTGNSTGPHLHFEVTENGVRVNPLSDGSRAPHGISDWLHPLRQRIKPTPPPYHEGGGVFYVRRSFGRSRGQGAAVTMVEKHVRMHGFTRPDRPGTADTGAGAAPQSGQGGPEAEERRGSAGGAAGGLCLGRAAAPGRCPPYDCPAAGPADGRGTGRRRSCAAWGPTLPGRGWRWRGSG